jgi:Asp-tRNA(Asn)/Glu-tRNA(Gln) amidotransferase A subunit family amidase
LFAIPRTVPHPASGQASPARRSEAFHLHEATIADIHSAIRGGRVTATQLVLGYLQRIKAYNGVCVNQPHGILGIVTPIENAGQINALITLNVRPQRRRSFGFDPRKARSMTDAVDEDPAMPDALERAAALDAHFARTGELVGPLHGVVMAIKDQYDTFDLRTTSGMDTPFANDRPPRDATVVKRLRDAGAVILAKANLGESASGNPRSSFGGVMCNPYDTARIPGLSSGGSATSVAANLVTCSIAESGGGSIVWPARTTSTVGIEPTQELVSRSGMAGKSLNTRTGPICRTVEDVARVLDVIAGYDPTDEQTAFAVGRRPAHDYAEMAREKALDGIRVGVVREYMDKQLFTQADVETIDIVDRAIVDLRGIGATIVDPGPGGALFQPCVNKYVPLYRNKLFIKQYPALFPAGADHIPLLVELFVNPSLMPGGPKAPSIRGFGLTAEDAPSFNPARDAFARTAGEGKYHLSLYLKERGDANIRTIADLAQKSTFYTDIRPDARMSDRKAALQAADAPSTLDNADRLLQRFAYQQVVLQCMAEQDLHAVTFPTGNIPSSILGAPLEPTANGRDASNWGLLGAQGFPVISVPAGFTTAVFDRVRDRDAPSGTRLVGPVAAVLPVGVNFLARPFDELVLFRIASAYEAATRHRVSPRGFGPLPGEP